MKTQSNMLCDKIAHKKSHSDKNRNAKRIAEFSYYAEEKDSIVSDQNKINRIKNNSFHLTSKEIAVLDSLARGNSYKMIAEDCNIATNTVREHIRNIYHKLNVHSCIEAVLLVLRQKLLTFLLFIHIISHDNAIDIDFCQQYLYLNF